MGYVKLVKNRNYYKRFRVKFRRRRNNITDYRLRRRLVQQDKRKYNAPKWRLVVRITNRDVIAQVACAKMQGDHILCAAYAHELKRYGLKVGLTNYAACYATGLLLARRLLTKLGLDKYYRGKKSLDGKRFISRVTNVHWKPDQKVFRPFKCVLDKGLARCTSGARIFAVMKGAIDGGLDVPHSVNRFPGFKKGKEGEKDEYNAEKLSNRIYGQHVAKYMTFLKENDPDKYNKHFSQYIKEGIEAEHLDDMYDKVHRAIRKDPSAPQKIKKDFNKMDVRKKQARWTQEQKTNQKVQRIADLRLKYSKQDKKKNNMDVDE